MSDTFPERYDQLQREFRSLAAAEPAVMDGFQRMHRGATTDGALSRRTKELMALAISVAVRCDGCIAYHVHDAVKAGASAEEIHEAIGVAVMMGGGPSAVYGADAMRAYEEFTAEEG